MSLQAITLNLPDTVYEQIRNAAEKSKRSVTDVLAEAVTAAVPATSDSLRSALAHMAYLNDAALWQAARATMLPDQRQRLEALHDQGQRLALTPQEQAEEQALLALYRETVLVRAQAATLLKLRGYDIADTSQFAPLE
jgi:hypothetical protein